MQPNPETNSTNLREHLDVLEEIRENATIHQTVYKILVKGYHNKRVK